MYEIYSKTAPLRGTVTIPGDKSISHRAVMFGSLAEGTTEVTNFLKGADCLSTIACFPARWALPLKKEKRLHPDSRKRSSRAFRLRLHMLDTGNSGTTTRLISGILAGQPFETTLTGDASIQKRPMGPDHHPSVPDGRPISTVFPEMAALHFAFTGSQLKRHPLSDAGGIRPGKIRRSCWLVSMRMVTTSVTESALTRNHTELMLRHFGAEITTEGTTLNDLSPNRI